MSNRRQRERELLEYYLLYLLLASRYLILIFGMLLLVYSAAIMMTSPFTGTVTLIPAIFLILLSSSFHVALYSARFGAWLGTLRKHYD